MDIPPSDHSAGGPRRGAAILLPLLLLCLAAAPARAQSAPPPPRELPAPAPMAPAAGSGAAPAGLASQPRPRIDLGIAALPRELEAAERSGDPQAQAKAFSGLGTLYLLDGRNEDALVALLRASVLYESLGNPEKVEKMRLLIDLVEPRP